MGIFAVVFLEPGLFFSFLLFVSSAGMETRRPDASKRRKHRGRWMISGRYRKGIMLEQAEAGLQGLEFARSAREEGWQR